MKDYRYILEPYNGMKTRYRCPNCEKNGVFTRYLDQRTGEYLDDKTGKCSRAIKCGYHFSPKQYFSEGGISISEVQKKPLIWKPKLKVKLEPNYIDKIVLEESIDNRLSNNFLLYLSHIWNDEVAVHLANEYNIGTSNHWSGATIFWQVDNFGKIRSGKVMLYNPVTGKRIKQPYNHINWIHKVLKLDNFHLQQCFFGEHLLHKHKEKPVAIVESEKTAIIASVFLPEFVWLACGSVHNLNNEKTMVLKGRSVVLFPDLGCFDLWNDKIHKLSKLATYRTSTLLEEKATDNERKQGFDIADYLTKPNIINYITTNLP
ncbi:DUF6371 domain-containing protein [Aquimarina addita]|uniref:DUF6371 domain-containing protein n=1 Tax=Aquimarina addita TaxID=870485 RepID=A0ABP6UMR1_9FLAO